MGTDPSAFLSVWLRHTFILADYQRFRSLKTCITIWMMQERQIASKKVHVTGAHSSDSDRGLSETRWRWNLVIKRPCSPVTVTAFKWLCPGVLPEVSGQLVASCKTPLAALPRTPVWFLTCGGKKTRETIHWAETQQECVTLTGCLCAVVIQIRPHQSAPGARPVTRALTGRSRPAFPLNLSAHCLSYLFILVLCDLKHARSEAEQLNLWRISNKC